MKDPVTSESEANAKLRLAESKTMKKISRRMRRALAEGPQGPSALMAIIVDAVALVYLLYITFDEYTSKPLGSESEANAKLRLAESKTMKKISRRMRRALAEGERCTEAEVNQIIDPRNGGICTRQKALAPYC
jgi:cytochrome c-type biogenesis protein CcmH/NrfG